MRETLILTHFNLLRVNQNETHLVWCRPHEQRRNDAVDTARLTRPCCSCDQHVRGRRKVQKTALPAMSFRSQLQVDVWPFSLLVRREDLRAQQVAVGHLELQRQLPSGQESGQGCAHRLRHCVRNVFWRLVTFATLTPGPSSSS